MVTDSTSEAKSRPSNEIAKSNELEALIPDVCDHNKVLCDCDNIKYNQPICNIDGHLRKWFVLFVNTNNDFLNMITCSVCGLVCPRMEEEISTLQTHSSRKIQKIDW